MLLFFSLILALMLLGMTCSERYDQELFFISSIKECFFLFLPSLALLAAGWMVGEEAWRTPVSPLN